ncbi:ATP-binding cassette domain-containing protein [Mycobacterium sp. ACS4331]|uniref:ABC transporter ATP-binding protein n=1 Tax=Mycobacterium sp. ACS4331 TaxID=1834121 RepID=UPI0008015C9F|nr:ATP-binding cassette domain-containing protein [Mycobacterium sp. ACS4331]OBF29716.1 ABC transporter ATP-binding protein [Mycobacterium sp. ACS4331]
MELQDVTFRRNGTQILQGISFTVRAGEQWALLGPNGAGKSTILSLCGAEEHPTTGSVTVLGGRLGRVEVQRLRRTIGHVNPRHPLSFPLRLREVVATGITGTIDVPMRWHPEAADMARVDTLIETLGLSHRAQDRWTTLSQGERGRALIARALVGRPKILLLDEPSTGLDLAAREQLLETIDKLVVSHPEMASIVVTHHLEELPTTTTHALLIADGHVVAQGPAQSVITSANVSEAFSHPIRVSYDDGRWAARAGR